VTSTAQAPGVDPSYPAHEQEALLLVELLRSSRLSLLYAEPGSDKTALLRFGLIPLLCRRAGDRIVPAAVRTSGVVVPFPDRRSRPSPRSSKRRREIVVYVDCRSESPLAALREALYEAVAADPTDRLQVNPRLSGILDDLSRRFDAHLIVLLDRFEDLLEASSNEPIDQFANELAEAINQPQLPANFLIALAEEAKPRLAGLRSRIPGFDDSSLKLAPPRDFRQAVAPPSRQAPSVPAAVEPLPVLTETVIVPEGDPMPAVPTVHASMVQAPAKKKVKHPPLPRVEIKTEDVYAMIDAALARITAGMALGNYDHDTVLSQARAHDRPPTASGRLKEPVTYSVPAATGLARPAIPVPTASARGVDLERAIERMERRLGIKPKDGRET
jgi:hypothetical protein